METMVRESWTDERLDEFGKRIDERFDRVDERFDEVDRRFEQVDKRFEQVDKRLDRIDVRFESMQGMMEKRFDTLQYSILYSVLGIFAAVMAGFVALILSG
jgi:DNA anti-recombination protein RmuC